MNPLFKDIKNNSNIYVLHKKDFEVKIAKINSASPARMEINRKNGKSEIVIDYNMTIDGKTNTFTIPENLSISYAGDLVLSTTMQGLTTDVEEVVMNADKIISNLDWAKMVKEKTNDIMAQINPSLKEKKETEQRFDNIENSISEMKNLIENFIKKLG